MHKKWEDGVYIAYFQANTNTHAPLPRLKEIYEEAITLDPNIVMLSIATRQIHYQMMSLSIFQT